MRVTPVNNDIDDVVLSDLDCITVTISEDFGENTAMIDYLSFNERCSMNHPMERGEGTKNMVMSVLSLCKRLFGVSKFSLSDMSSFFCEPSGGEVRLGPHNLLVYGKSWYERKFNAMISSNRDKSRWERSRSVLKSMVTREKAEIILSMIKRIYDGEEMDQFAELVESSIGISTWNEMFSSINMSFEGCVFFTGKMITLLIDMFSIPFGISWYIPISEDDASTYLLSYEKLPGQPFSLR